jgi:hypothetical protein
MHLFFKKDNWGTLEIKFLSYTKNLLQEHLIAATPWVFVSKRKKKQINSIVAFHRQQKYQMFSKTCLSIKSSNQSQEFGENITCWPSANNYGTNIFAIILAEHQLTGLNNEKWQRKYHNNFHHSFFQTFFPPDNCSIFQNQSKYQEYSSYTSSVVNLLINLTFEIELLFKVNIYALSY